jgi:soluble lytic murein transglycosylase
MQLRPFVARDVAHRTAVDWNGLETLYEPRLNVRLGARYFDELVERFDGDSSVALTAYNFGPTHVATQLSLGTYAGSGYASSILDLYAHLSARRGSFTAEAAPVAPTI